VTSIDDGGLRLRAVSSVAEARRRVADEDLDAAVVVPEGFAASLAGDDPAAVEVIARPSARIGGLVAEAVAEALTTRTDAIRLAAATADALDAPAPPPDSLADLELPVTVSQRSTGDGMSPAAYFGPSMGLLFLFLGMAAVARGLLEERRRQLLDRLRAAPVQLNGVLAGRCLSTVAVGVASLLVIWAATAGALGADWGDPLGVVALVLASALTVAGFAGLVAALAGSEQSAESIATFAGFVLALLGGNFLPPGSLPGPLQQVSLFTPNGWALRGFAELSAGRGGLVDVLPHVGVLLAWAAVTGFVAARLLPRRLGA
jgi:ABC-2 type transport system permease protein